MKKILLMVTLIFCVNTNALGHSGRTDANGCHTNHKTGEYHCHKRK